MVADAPERVERAEADIGATMRRRWDSLGGPPLDARLRLPADWAERPGAPTRSPSVVRECHHADADAGRDGLAKPAVTTKAVGVARHNVQALELRYPT